MCPSVAVRRCDGLIAPGSWDQVQGGGQARWILVDRGETAMALLPVLAFFQGRDGRPTGMETADSLNLDRMHNSLLGALQQGVLGLGTGGTYATLRRALQRLSVQCQQYCKRRRYKQYKHLSVTQTQFSLSPCTCCLFPRHLLLVRRVVLVPSTACLASLAAS